MSVTKKGYSSQFMASLFKKEATYDAGVTMNNTNACSFSPCLAEVSWPDKYETDRDKINGSEFATHTEIAEAEAKIVYSEDNARVNSVLGFGGLALGGITTTQDGAVVAYRHKIIPVADTVALPSIHAEAKVAGIQYKYTGIMANSFGLSAQAGGYVKMDADLLCSGTRATSATAMAAAITGAPENWLKFRNSKIWKESGASISLDATLTQAAQNISSGSGTDLTNRIKSFSFKWNNNLEMQNAKTGCHYGVRSMEFKMQLLMNDDTELNHYLNQDNIAFEIDLKNSTTLIAESGTFYPGIHLIVPCCRLKAAPLPSGKEKGTLTIDVDVEIVYDGTNPAVILEGYNAQAAYLAA